LAYGVRIDLMLSVTIYLPPIMPRNGNYDWALVNDASPSMRERIDLRLPHLR
jgi:hypothetical protein